MQEQNSGDTDIIFAELFWQKKLDFQITFVKKLSKI